MLGGEDNDVLFGGQGTDTLAGGGGDDTIAGNRDDDVLTGNGGDDRFVFNPGDGRDRITDFTAGDDDIDLSLWSFDNFSDFQSDVSTSVVDGGIAIDFGDGDVLTVIGGGTTLDGGWFIF